MPLTNFFAINLPYGIERNADGKWFTFNRERMPIGYNKEIFAVEIGETVSEPIYTAYKYLTDDFLKSLVDSEADIFRDEAGKITKVYLYDINSNPLSNSRNWNPYFEKLKKLSVLEAKD